MKQTQYILLFSLLLSCSAYNSSKQHKKIQLKNYTGWWIYGQEHHIFKDEKTLEEWEIFFINEDKKQMEILYLEVAGMEYFPLDCVIRANLFKKDEQKIIEIADFEITYIEGCGD